MQVFELQYTVCDVCECKKKIPSNVDPPEWEWVQIWVDNTSFVHHRNWQENSLMFATGYKILDICSLTCVIKFLNDKRRKENGNG